MYNQSLPYKAPKWQLLIPCCSSTLSAPIGAKLTLNCITYIYIYMHLENERSCILYVLHSLCKDSYLLLVWHSQLWKRSTHLPMMIVTLAAVELWDTSNRFSREVQHRTLLIFSLIFFSCSFSFRCHCIGKIHWLTTWHPYEAKAEWRQSLVPRTER